MKYPPKAHVIQSTEGQTVHLMARVVTKDNVAVQQSGITGTGGQEITRNIFDMSVADPIAGIATSSLDKTAKIFDTLQTDAEWTADTTGYNFLDSVATADLATGTKRWRVQYSMVVTGEETITWEYFVDVQDVYGS